MALRRSYSTQIESPNLSVLSDKMLSIRKCILNASHDLIQEIEGIVSKALLDLSSENMRLQSIMFDPKKNFNKIISESVLKFSTLEEAKSNFVKDLYSLHHPGKIQAYKKKINKIKTIEIKIKKKVL